ncbi:MAG TPA: PCRF domain-containing protein [Candidatus Paceibacterota bacterium]|nr:PCRF domain-containing protein [Candidatus Paceibacterota bacterium]
MSAEEKKARIAELEAAMQGADFWADKARAQAAIKELQTLKAEAEGGSAYDKGGAVMTIFAGAGGDDAEDFARMLLNMYQAYAEGRGWGMRTLSASENDHGGYRSVTVELDGKNIYGTLKNESGVHRLVRLSPFNAKALRQTSFAMVEVIPQFEKADKAALKEEEISVEFTRSGGPGGQNVNRRETAVRIVHLPTKLAVHVDSERSQAQNREKGLALLSAKLYKREEEERKSKEAGLYVSKTTEAAWGNQIRSYVLHPYKLVKDHRTGVEAHDAEKVLEGDLDAFLEAEKAL